MTRSPREEGFEKRTILQDKEKGLKKRAEGYDITFG